MKFTSNVVFALALVLSSTQLGATGTSDTTEAVDSDTSVEATEEQVQFDAEAGEALYMKNCRACHGPKGKGLSAYPKLAGKTAEHLTEKLEQYRAGEKLGPNTMLMAPRAKNLSDEDIGNIVAFITTLE